MVGLGSSCCAERGNGNVDKLAERTAASPPPVATAVGNAVAVLLPAAEFIVRRASAAIECSSIRRRCSLVSTPIGAGSYSWRTRASRPVGLGSFLGGGGGGLQSNAELHALPACARSSSRVACVSLLFSTRLAAQQRDEWWEAGLAKIPLVPRPSSLLGAGRGGQTRSDYCLFISAAMGHNCQQVEASRGEGNSQVWATAGAIYSRNRCLYSKTASDLPQVEQRQLQPELIRCADIHLLVQCASALDHVAGIVHTNKEQTHVDTLDAPRGLKQ